MANSVFSKSAQVRRGLSKGLEFFTAQELARQASERESQRAVAKTQAQRMADTEKQRFQTALDLAKLGNLGAQGALQSYVQRGEPGALAGIGEFDENAARNYQLAKEFGLPLTKEEQFGPANELFRRLGIGTQVGTTPTQKSRIGAFDALKSQRETDSLIAEKMFEVRKTHYDNLDKAVQAKIREINQRIGKGKDVDLGDYIDEIDGMQDIIVNEMKELVNIPGFWAESPDELLGTPGVPNPQYLNRLQDLNGRLNQVGDMGRILNEYQNKRIEQLTGIKSQFQTPRPLAPGQIPSRSVQPYQQHPEEFIRQLMQSRAGAGTTQTPAAPPIAPPAQPMPQTPSVPQTPPTVMTVPQSTPQVIQTPDGARWRVNADGSYTQIP